MPQTIKQPTGGGTAFGEIVRPAWVNAALPKVAVRFGHPAVVDAAELAVGGPEKGGCDARACFGGWVENPARGGTAKVVGFPLFCWGLWFWRPPEEDITIGDGEVDDDVPGWVFVTACYVALEACGMVSVGGGP